MAIKAYILVITNPLQTQEVFQALRRLEGVDAVHQVMGPYDVVMEVTAEQLADIPALLSTYVRRIPGVEGTTSLVTFPSEGDS